MLRRFVGSPSQARSGHATVGSAKASFFGGWGGGNKSSPATGASSTGSSTSADGNAANSATGGFPGFPPGMDAQKFQAMQQLFESQPPEKREQMMKQALEFQKMMSKVPGLGKLTKGNQKMMEALLNMTQNEPKQGPGTFSGTSAAANRRNMREMFVPPAAATATAPPSTSSTHAGTPNRSSSTSSTTANSGKGPTLDELKKVNLGPEIEALFEELRSVRSTKNSYRDRYQAADKELQRVQKEWGELKQTESSLREKIKRSERDVMLLTSENMTLQESSKKVKELASENARLLQRLQQAEKKLVESKTAGTPSYEALSQQLQSKENSLRSLKRKLDRMRRDDPMYQFSLACSSVCRLCEREGGGRDPGEGVVEGALEHLNSIFHQKKKEAWHQIAEHGGHPDKIYLDAAKRFVSARVPYAYLDATVTVEGDAAAATRDFEKAGFSVTAAAPEDAKRLSVTAPATADPLKTPGPYGYALAMCLAPPEESGYKLAAAHPIVSPELLENAKRCEVNYETARASGPGGQAANVAETQIYAKLQIDGEAVYTAEAQDSRSAMNNKEAALQKLKGARRVQFNQTLSRQQRPEEVFKTLAAEVAAQEGFEVPDGMLAEVRNYVKQSQELSPLEACFVLLLDKLQIKVGAPVPRS